MFRKSGKKNSRSLFISLAFVGTCLLSWALFRALQDADRRHVRMELEREALAVSRALADVFDESGRTAEVILGTGNFGDSIFNYQAPPYTRHPVIKYTVPEIPLDVDRQLQARRNAAMDRARATGLPAATARLDALDNKQNPGIQVFFPVYRQGRAPQRLPAPPEELAGFLVADHRLPRLLRTVLARASGQDVGVAVFDLSDEQAPDLLFRTPSLPQDLPEYALSRAAAERETVSLTRPLLVAGRKWEMRFTAGASFVAERTSRLTLLLPLAVFFCGLSFCGFFAFLQGKADVIKEQAGELAVAAAALAQGLQERNAAAQSLAKSESRYRLLFENAPLAVAVADFSEIRHYFLELRQKGISAVQEFFAANPGEVAACLSRLRLSDVNQEAIRAFGAADKEEVLRGLDRIIVPETLDSCLPGLLAIDLGKRSFEHEVLVHSLNGLSLRGVVKWAVAPESVRDYRRVILFFTDITARRMAEEKMRLYSRRMALLNSIDHAILAAKSTKDIARTAISALRREIPCLGVCVYLFDYEKKVIEALAIDSVVPVPLYDDVTLAFRCETFIGKLKAGTTLHLCDEDMNASCPMRKSLLTGNIAAFITVPLVVEGGIIGGLSIFSARRRDLNSEQIELVREVAGQLAVAIQNARLLAAVSLHRGQLQKLSRRLVETEEGERRRIACDLHDKVGQQLSALDINIHLLEQGLPPDERKKHAGRIHDSLALLEGLTTQVRDIMADLRPPVLDDFGLGAALRWFGAVFASRTGIRTQVSGGDPPRFDPALEIAVFRVLQEAMTNVAKHAGVSELTVHVNHAGGLLSVSVADKGRGWDSGAAATTAQKGLGLISMRERIEPFGGRVKIQSRPGLGTTIFVEVRT